MKATLASIFVLLVLLTLVAWRTEPAPPRAGVTRLVWVSDPNPLRKKQIELFNGTHEGVEVALDSNNTGSEKVIVQSIGGVGPDLFDCYSGPDFDAYSRAGIAWDITDELAKLGIDVMKETWPVARPAFSNREGRIFAVPANVGHVGIWFNKEMFDAAGVPYPKGPWSLSEFVQVAQKLTLRDRRGRATQYGLLMDPWAWRGLYPAWGASLYSEDLTRCTVDSPEMIAALTFFKDLMYKYKVAPTPVEESTMAAAGGWGTGPMTLFGARRGAMALGGRWWLATFRSRTDLKLGVVEPPHATRRAWSGQGRVVMINRFSPRREEALKFLAFLATEAYNQQTNDQADGLAPFKKYCYGPRFERNPEFPQETYNDVWREVTARAVPEAYSPFVSSRLANRLIDVQVDLVRTGQKDVRLALQTAARQVNAEIARNIAKDPELKRLYEEMQSGS